MPWISLPIPISTACSSGFTKIIVATNFQGTDFAAPTATAADNGASVADGDDGGESSTAPPSPVADSGELSMAPSPSSPVGDSGTALTVNSILFTTAFFFWLPIIM